MPEPPHPGRAGDPEGSMPSAIRAVASPNGRGTFLTLSATGEDGHGDETADKQLTTTAAAEDEDQLSDDNNKERTTDEEEDEEGTGIVFEPTLRALTASSTTDSANALLNPVLLTEPHTNHLPRGHRHMPEPPHPGRAGDPEGSMSSAIRAVASPNGRGTFLTLSATGEDGHGDETADKQPNTTAAAEDEDPGAALTEAYKQLAMELKASGADPTTEGVPPPKRQGPPAATAGR